uniref:Uncharacterized protein n=1 Tax=Ixodes ricinus TaxID=34613 RepID=A0A6B0TSR9_IXORI
MALIEWTCNLVWLLRNLRSNNILLMREFEGEGFSPIFVFRERILALRSRYASRHRVELSPRGVDLIAAPHPD